MSAKTLKFSSFDACRLILTTVSSFLMLGLEIFRRIQELEIFFEKVFGENIKPKHVRGTCTAAPLPRKGLAAAPRKFTTRAVKQFRGSLPALPPKTKAHHARIFFKGREKNKR